MHRVKSGFDDLTPPVHEARDSVMASEAQKPDCNDIKKQTLSPVLAPYIIAHQCVSNLILSQITKTADKILWDTAVQYSILPRQNKMSKTNRFEHC